MPLTAGHARADFVSFTGRIPFGTVAIAHTHPPRLPFPSALDAADEARRLDVPFVVLTDIPVCASNRQECLSHTRHTAASLRRPDLV